MTSGHGGKGGEKVILGLNNVSGMVPDSIGGAEGDRTPDLLTASQALSQLSYSPTLK